MHKVEQSDYLLCEGLHEGIISEKDWYAAQEKRKLNNYKREKVLVPEHAHILSGILKCPCCGKSLYGNMSKAHSKDNKNRLENQMDALDVKEKHYEKKCNDLKKRHDKQYDIIDSIEKELEDALSRKKQFLFA